MSALPDWMAPDSERIRDGEAGLCPFCGRVIRAVNPAGGDGSARRFVKHGPRTKPCAGSRTYVPGLAV